MLAPKRLIVTAPTVEDAEKAIKNNVCLHAYMCANDLHIYEDGVCIRCKAEDTALLREGKRLLDQFYLLNPDCRP